MILTDDQKLEIGEFIKSHPSPRVYWVSTIRDGTFVAINPVPTLFGAEIMCAPDVLDAVKAAITGRG